MGDLEEDGLPVVGPGVVGVEGDDAVDRRALGIPAARRADSTERKTISRGERRTTEDLEDPRLGVLQGLDLGHGAEELADPGEVGSLLADGGQRSPRASSFSPLQAPGQDDAGQVQPEEVQAGGMDLGGEPEEPGEGLELAVDPGIDAGVEEDDVLGQLAEEGLRGLGISGPARLDVGLPVRQPAGQDEERAVLEEPVEDVLVGDPFEALALLVEPAAPVEPELLRRPRQAVAAGQGDGTAVPAARGHGLSEARPRGFGLIAMDRERDESDVLEFRRGPESQDLTAEARAGDQADMTSHLRPIEYVQKCPIIGHIDYSTS